MLFWLWQSMFFSTFASRASVASEVPIPAATMVDADICVRALLDNRLLLTLDHHGIVYQVSGNALDMLDIDTNQLGQINLVSLLHTSHKPLFLFNGNKVELPLQKRAQLRHKSGNYVWYSLTYHPHPQGILLIMEPVNILVEAERSLRNAQVDYLGCRIGPAQCPRLRLATSTPHRVPAPCCRLWA